MSNRYRDKFPLDPPSLLLIWFASLMNRRQQAVIEHLQEEVRVLQEQVGKRRRFTEDQRRRQSGWSS